MQGQRRYEKEKDDHHAQLDEEQEDKFSKFPFVNQKQVGRPRDRSAPKQACRSEIEQGEDETDNKSGKEKVPKKDDLFVFHTAHYLFERSHINHKQSQTKAAPSKWSPFIRHFLDIA